MTSPVHQLITVATAAPFACHDLTGAVQELIDARGIQQGLLVALARHTTTALVINEAESRLLTDIERFFSRLVPAGEAYLHNDLHLRDVPPDEPRNAHSHLIALMLGVQQTVPIVDGRLGLGRYQSLLLVELDGPRERQVLVQLSGG